MGRIASGKYVYKPGDHKHLHTWRDCAHCGERYLGRVDSRSRYCSRSCAGKATGKQPRPAASQAGYLVCTKCGEEKPEKQFDRHAQSRAGRRPHCKTCRAAEWQATKTPELLAARREIGRQWAAANRERANAKVARWRTSNPLGARAVRHRRRGRKHGSVVATITAVMLAAKWDYWSGRCWMCGGEATEMDHVKPLAKGGAHILANLRPACAPCNRRKNARWPYTPS